MVLETKVGRGSGPERGGAVAILVWFVASLFYLYEYLVRVLPSVMLDELEVAFRASPDQLAVSIGTYAYIYAPLQLVVGVLFDRYGGKRLLVPATFFVALGCLLASATGGSIWILALSRFLMGSGSAFGFVGAIYLVTVWYAENRIAAFSGLTTAIGMVGAILGQAAMARVVDTVGWEDSFRWSGYAGLVLVGVLIMSIPKAPHWEIKRRELLHEKATSGHFWDGLKQVLLNPQIWIIGFVGSCLWLPLSLFADFWGVKYIMKIAEVSKSQATGTTSMLYLGFMIGASLAGWASDFFQVRRRLLFWGCLASASLIWAFLLFPKVPLAGVYALLFSVSFVSGVQIICFAAGIAVNARYLKGTSVAVVNMIVSLVGAVLQYVVGHTVKTWGVLNEDGIIQYTAQDLRLALLIMPIFLTVSALVCLKMKETHPRAALK